MRTLYQEIGLDYRFDINTYGMYITLYSFDNWYYPIKINSKFVGLRIDENIPLQDYL